jgi:hypothetical protein
MTELTPGPWRFEWDLQHEYTYTIVAPLGAGGKTPLVADIITSDNAEANARLIAASPDLLEALQGVKSWMEDCMIDTQDPELPSRMAYDQTCAAIAKTKGEAN